MATQIKTPLRLNSCILQVWTSICPDMGDLDDEFTNSDAIESCLDADRILLICGDVLVNEWLQGIRDQGLFRDLVNQLDKELQVL